MNEYLKTLGLFRPLPTVTEFHRKAFSRNVELDVDEAIDEDDLGSYDSKSLYTPEEDLFRIEASHLDNLTLPSSSDSLLRKSVVSQLKIIQSPNYWLNPLESLCVSEVLQETNDQLDIIKRSLPAAIKVDSSKYRSIKERFGNQGQRKLVYPEEGPTRLETYYMKMQRTCQYLTEILDDTKIEIQRNSTYNVLRKATAAEYDMKIEAEELLEEDAKSSKQLRGAKKQIGRMARVVEENVSEARVILKTKEGKIHDAIIMAEIERNHMERWEESRTEQCNYILDGVHRVLEEGVINSRQQVDEEYRANIEIETYLTMIQNDLADSVDLWQQSYERDLDDKEHDLIQLRIEKEAQQNRYLEMQEIMGKRKEEIDEYLVQKKERRRQKKAQQYERMLNRMATRIQVWWRDVMKARGLGPYKKKKGKNNKAKKMRRKETE